MVRTVCVIDDEFLARERVKRLLMKRNDFTVVGEADNGWDAVSLIKEKKPDIVILDIYMPALSGFEILEQIEEQPLVIFVTAYDMHAVKAFEVHALDYLLKPFHDDRFFQALDRVSKASPMDEDVLISLRLLLEGRPQPAPVMTKITVKDNFEYRVVDIADIDYFGTDGGLVFLHTRGHRYVIDQTLTQLEEALPGDVFFRAHRKSLININRVLKVIPWGRGRYVLKFPGDESVHLSKDKTRQFKVLVGLM